PTRWRIPRPRSSRHSGAASQPPHHRAQPRPNAAQSRRAPPPEPHQRLLAQQRVRPALRGSSEIGHGAGPCLAHGRPLIEPTIASLPCPHLRPAADKREPRPQSRNAPTNVEDRRVSSSTSKPKSIV